MIKNFLSILFILILIGCQNSENKKFNVGLMDSNGFQELLNSNKGNVLVVNIWATWCVPCVEEMPDLNKLANYYKDENVKIVAISIDYTDEIKSKILPFVKKQNLNFAVYVNNFKNDEQFINFFNKDWSGAIPATFIYDKTGSQKEFLLGKHSFDDFKKSIENHL